ISDPLTGPRAQHGGRGDVLQGQTTASRDLLGADEVLQRLHGRVDDVDRVRGPEALGEDVLDAGALQDGTHRATGDDAGTGAGRLQEHDTGGTLTLDRVRDGAGDPRDLEEVLLRLLHALGDRGRHLLRLAVADTDHAVTVAHHDQRGEAEATTTLHDLGDPVDGHHALEVRGLVLGRPATATVATVPAVPAVTAVSAVVTALTALAAAELPRTSRHQAILPVFVCITRTPARLRGPRRRAPRSGRGSRCHRGRTRPS